MIQPRIRRAALSCSTLISIATFANAATTRYVRADAAPGGAGTSWASAHNDLQAALSAALPGDQIWVKAGAYRPGPIGSPRTVTFQMKAGVAVYGGFAGNETALAQRDWKTNVTVLSGDLGLDDGPNFTHRGDNALHVVTSNDPSSSAVLDGFTVRSGNATNSWGGGLWCSGLTLRNSTVTDNEAFAGGAMCMLGSWFGSTVSGCTFRGNRAVNGGGALLIYEHDFVLSECVFALNRAESGGAIKIYFEPQAPGLIRNCLFVRNTGVLGAGAIRSSYCELTVVNTTFAYNHSPSVGGIVAEGQNLPVLSIANSIAYGNSGSASLSLYERQVWFAPISAVNSAIEGSAFPFNQDPRWQDADGPDDVLGTADDDFRLSCLSPYIDRGHNSYSAGIASDLAGAPRFADDPATPDTGIGTAPIVDLGPYEFVCACDEYENYCATNSNSSGAPAAIGASGSTSLFANAFELHVHDAAPNKNGIFFYGANAIANPWGEGVRCVASPVFRLPVLTTDAAGAASFALDFTQPPASSGPGQLLPGSTWRFQFYFRDPAGGPFGWNTSDGLRVTFCP